MKELKNNDDRYWWEIKTINTGELCTSMQIRRYSRKKGWNRSERSSLQILSKYLYKLNRPDKMILSYLYI